MENDKESWNLVSVSAKNHQLQLHLFCHKKKFCQKNIQEKKNPINYRVTETKNVENSPFDKKYSKKILKMLKNHLFIIVYTLNR